MGGWRAIYHGPPASGTASVPHPDSEDQTKPPHTCRAWVGEARGPLFFRPPPSERVHMAPSAPALADPTLRCALIPRSLEPSRPEPNTLTQERNFRPWERIACVQVLGRAWGDVGPQAAEPGHLKLTCGARPRVDGRGRCRAAWRVDTLQSMPRASSAGLCSPDSKPVVRWFRLNLHRARKQDRGGEGGDGTRC